MVRVGFHLHNDGQETVDCSRIIYGNPGIGGAEYAIIAIAYMLSVDKNDIEVRLYAHKQGIFPSGLEYNVCNNVENAVTIASQDNLDYFSYEIIIALYGTLTIITIHDKIDS